MKWKILLGIVFAVIYLISLSVFLYISSHEAGLQNLASEVNPTIALVLIKVMALLYIIALAPFMFVILMSQAMSAQQTLSFSIGTIIGAILNLVTYFFIGFGLGTIIDKAITKKN